MNFKTGIVMRPLIILALLATTTAAATTAVPAIAQQAADDRGDKPIVVTARSLSETERALKDCIKRKCPPDEDAKATLAHAENQFVSGSYKDARATMLNSIDRNGRAAKKYPVPVADLYRANARIAAHLGEGDDYRLSTLRSRDALKAGLPADDWRILVSSLEVGDMRARLGYPQEAERIYDEVAKAALEKGWNGLADMATLRGALLMLASNSSTEQAKGRARLEDLASRPGDKARSLRLASKIILVRKARNKAEAEAATKLVLAEYAASGGAKSPTLLFAEPIKQVQARGGKGEGRTALSQANTQSVEDNWVDVGFWVAPDGKTTDIEILRQSQKDIGWTKPVIDSIRTRIYAPVQADIGDPGVFKVERYSLTAQWEEQLGTRIRQRSAQTRIERIDLSDDAPAAAK
jgi:hypothetical protein